MIYYSIMLRKLRKIVEFCTFSVTGFIFCTSFCLANDTAFPGAIGFGKSAIGWRGGEIISITNLNDNGPGSLRNCLQNSKNSRICIFNISGTIYLDSPIFVASDVYLAGQTAPGNGVQLRLRSGDKTPIIIKNANNVLIRFLKVRPGAGNNQSANIDAVTIESSNNVYLDALSLQFASDETFNIHVNKRPVYNITLARSILSHSLDRSVHPKGRHSKGALICSNEGSLEKPAVPCGLITIAKNLFAHHRDRNPDVKGTDIGPIEIINNIFYNPISQLGEFYDLLGDVTIHYVGNVTLSGPSSNGFIYSLPSVEVFSWDEDRKIWVFETDNINFSSKGCRAKSGVPILDSEAEKVRINAPILPLSFVPYAADEVINEIIDRVGANLSSWGGPDALDKRAIEDFQNCKGHVIDTPEQADGWPVLAPVSQNEDRDADGLPDAWEASHNGLDPTIGNQTWEDRDNDGWSNIEEYLSWLAGDKE